MLDSDDWVSGELAAGAASALDVGGDGSLHRTINLLAQKNRLKSIELAVVPAGTCNDFARFIGLRRRRMENAFQVAYSGTPLPADLGISVQTGSGAHVVAVEGFNDNDQAGIILGLRLEMADGQALEIRSFHPDISADAPARHLGQRID